MSKEEDAYRFIGESDRREWTPEDRVSLRRLRESLPHISLEPPPSLAGNFSGLVGLAHDRHRLLKAMTPAIEVANLGFRRPEAKVFLGSHQGLAALAAVQSKFIESMKPAVRVADLLGTRTAFVDVGMTQPTWTSQVMRNVDFGVSQQMTAVANLFTASQLKVWESIAASALAIARAFYPPNLRDIEDIGLSTIIAVAFDEGIPLYLVPRQETAELLLAAEGREERLAVLEKRSTLVIEDCRGVLAECQSFRMAQCAAKAAEAAAALEAGFASASQALIGSILEALVWDYFGRDKRRFVPSKSGKTTREAYDELQAHEFLAFAPVWQAFQQYDLTKGDSIPPTFSRHATAHTVSEAQYTRANALQGLMLACSLVAYVDAVSVSEAAA